MLINVDNLSFSYGGTQILSDISFSVSEDDKIGLVGGNGEGKTTLIKLILGTLEPDSGSVYRKNGIRIGYLEQNADFSSGNTVFAEMKNIFSRDVAAIENLSLISAALSKTAEGSGEYKTLSAKYENLNKFIAARDSYNYEVKIKTVLNGMGFNDFYDRKISDMSGGEKTRLKLCRLLLEEPELLILDEPTNHLDIKTLFWLEDYLSSYRGALFVVSHDRYFLDKLTKKTFELERKVLSQYRGNYTAYKRQKAEKIAFIEKEYEKQQAEIAHIQDFIDKNRYQATKAKSAQSRIKTLEKMDVIEKPVLPPAPPFFKFEYDERPYEKVLEIKNLSLSAGNKTLITDGALTVKRGEKCAVVGDNGTGKTTLIREIVFGKNPAISKAAFTKIAYYDQENANLDGEETVLYELWKRHITWDQTRIRKVLAEAKLDEGDIDKKVKFLSGGERAKLALAVFECERGNFLILDEPTNHLDLPARESLEEALKVFDGTVLFVSHDRYFIQAVAGKIAEIGDGKITEFAGDYAAYNEYKRTAAENAAKAESERKYSKAAKTAAEKKESSFRSKAERNAEAKKKERIKNIEKEISLLETEEEEINKFLSSGGDYKEISARCIRLGEIKDSLDALYAEYEKLI